MEGKAAALPSGVAIHVERLICAHRKDRRTLLQKKPVKWEEKLSQVNSRIMTIVWNVKTSSVAENRYIQRSTRVVQGQLEFCPGCGKNFELIRLSFSLGDEGDVAGAGTYWLSSKSYPPREVCCISARAERTGFDLLRQNYEGSP